jgi:hypothetical protein
MKLQYKKNRTLEIIAEHTGDKMILTTFLEPGSSVMVEPGDEVTPIKMTITPKQHPLISLDHQDVKG